jgi:hypothetical protein
MKRLLSLFLFLTITFYFHSQHRASSYKNTFKTEEFYLNNNSINDFEVKGQVKEIHHGKDVYKFNINGQLLKVITEDSIITRDVQYNEQEEISQILIRFSFGDEWKEEKCTFKYDKDGRLTNKSLIGRTHFFKTIHYKSKNKLDKASYLRVEGQDTLFMEENYNYSKKILTSINRVYRSSFNSLYDYSQLDHTEHFEYYDNKVLKKSQIIYRTISEMETNQITYLYDKNANLTMEYIDDSTRSYMVKEFIYDKNQNLIKEINRGNYDGLYHNTWDYTYIFDNKGNWIERNESYTFIKPSKRDNLKLDFNNPHVVGDKSYNRKITYY